MTAEVSTTEVTTPSAPSAEIVAPTGLLLAGGVPTPAAQTTPTTAADTSSVITYDPTGDAGLDYALGYVGRLGFGTDHPAIQAAMQGNMALLRVELAQLGDKALGHAEVVALAEDAYKRVAGQQAEADKALGTYVAQAAGSAERWAAVAAWASSAADPKEKQAINAQLAAGGVQAKMAADYLIKCYEKSSGATKEPGKVASSNASPGSNASGSSPLTASDYSAAVQALTRAAGGRDPTGSPAYAALQSRRLAGRKQGI